MGKRSNVQLSPVEKKEHNEILTPEALLFLEELHVKFAASREERLRARLARQGELEAGRLPDFLPETSEIRKSDWKVAMAPKDLEDRRVEITGPVDRKMMINAFNSGARVFMADFEDALSPTWANILEGQINIRDAVRKLLYFKSPEGKVYKLGGDTATLKVRPRGWHLVEKNITLKGQPLSASLCDFGLTFFHNAKELIRRGSGPYFYLPKMESHLEARLWNDIFSFSEDFLGIPQGSIRATVLIETVLAAYEMDEILYELRPYASGLNAGRWDYIFSLIKKYRNHSEFILPDRSMVTMSVPFMKAYCELLVETCHRRGAHAMGGMAAFVPSRKDPEINRIAYNKVREDKEREANLGFDGTWVAHPDLVAVAREAFDQKFIGRNNQKDKKLSNISISAEALRKIQVPGGRITREGIKNNISVGIQYLERWLSGVGAAAIFNLMEDAATAEIARAQLWQWIRHGAKLESGEKFTKETYSTLRKQVCEKLEGWEEGRYGAAIEILDNLVLNPDFCEFLTLRAYEYLDRRSVSMATIKESSSPLETLKLDWQNSPRWKGIIRNYKAEDVIKLRPSLEVEHTLARCGAERLWKLVNSEPQVMALGAVTGAQAVQMVKAGLKAIYCSGWQVAADANLSLHTYPDQSLYPSNSVPNLVRRINNSLRRADEVTRTEGDSNIYWYAPIVADAEAGFGGPLHSFELMKSMIEAGAGGVHFEDQLAAEKKCGHLGGKVLIPTSQFIRTLVAARLASDVMGIPTVIIARTDALSATLLTSNIDPRDEKFLTGQRTPEGYFFVRDGIESVIARGLAYAPFADMLWFETSKPDLDEAKEFSLAIQAKYPGKLLTYNCSPSFNWRKNLDDKAIARFHSALGEMGYKFQFITLAGWHVINYHTFDLAKAYAGTGMSAYVTLQDQEFRDEKEGYTAVRHQREVGTGYFDEVLMTVTGGEASTAALSHSTEADQFGH